MNRIHSTNRKLDLPMAAKCVVTYLCQKEISSLSKLEILHLTENLREKYMHMATNTSNSNFYLLSVSFFCVIVDYRVFILQCLTQRII